MSAHFDYFVILAGMRTGSNFLEDSLNRFDGIHCFGEVFNPVFVGKPSDDTLFGMTVADAAANPAAMIARLKENAKGLPGFRLFAGHNTKALAHVLTDTRCAKIVLSRSPVDSYVSLQIARATDQWKLGDVRNRRSAKIRFDADGFAAYLQENRDYYGDIRRVSREKGQALFEISYDELGDDGLIEGLVRYLGIDKPKATGAIKARKQNPEPLPEKVENFDDMLADLAAMDPLAIHADPVFEPARGTALGHYMACTGAPLLFMPIPSGPVATVCAWMTAVDAGTSPQDGYSQKTLRQWKRQHKGHRSFTVIRHPVLRAFDAFASHLLETGRGHFPMIREQLLTRYKLALPDTGPAGDVEKQDLKKGFLDFLTFLRGNLAGQTTVRIDPSWASQAATITGMAGFALPDHIFREESLPDDLTYLCAALGLDCPQLAPETARSDQLAVIYDDEIEKAARAAYQRDYMIFGLDRWRD